LVPWAAKLGLSRLVPGNGKERQGSEGFRFLLGAVVRGPTMAGMGTPPSQHCNTANTLSAGRHLSGSGGCRGDEPAYFDRMARGVRQTPSARRRTWIASGKSFAAFASLDKPLARRLLSASVLGPIALGACPIAGGRHPLSRLICQYPYYPYPPGYYPYYPPAGRPVYSPGPQLYTVNRVIRPQVGRSGGKHRQTIEPTGGAETACRQRR